MKKLHWIILIIPSFILIVVFVIFGLIITIGHNIKQAGEFESSLDKQTFLFHKKAEIPDGVKSVALLSKLTGGTFEYGPPESSNASMEISSTVSSLTEKILLIESGGTMGRKVEDEFTFEITDENTSDLTMLNFYLNIIEGDIKVIVLDPNKQLIHQKSQGIESTETNSMILSSLENPKKGTWTVVIEGSGNYKFIAFLN